LSQTWTNFLNSVEIVFLVKRNFFFKLCFI
jgi:hypothetical protein